GSAVELERGAGTSSRVKECGKCRNCRICPDASCFFFSSRRRHTRSVSAFLLNRSSDLMKTYNWEGVNPDGYFLDKLEPIPSALPSFQKLFQVSATALSIP